MIRKEVEQRIKLMIPKGELLGVHLAYLSSDKEVVESMLAKLQQVGTTTFLSELSEPYLRVLYSFISQRVTPKWEEQEPKRQQWEYLPTTHPDVTECGRNGWELVTIYNGTFYFKRPCNG